MTDLEIVISALKRARRRLTNLRLPASLAPLQVEMMRATMAERGMIFDAILEEIEAAQKACVPS